MKMKRFTGKDMRSAMKQVRVAFGPDAVIISNQKVEHGVEILAAMDFDAVELHSVPEVTATTTPAVSSESLDELKAQIAQLSEFTTQQFSKLCWKEQAVTHPRQALLFKRLAELGLSPSLCQHLTNAIQLTHNIEKNWTEALDYLCRLIPVKQNEILHVGGVHALVGPTGVGKTTTIAKLAARFCVNHSAEDIALITMDTYRIAGVEQLKLYGNLLSIPVYVADDESALQSTLYDLRDKKLVLIDTAGMSQRDQRFSQQLELLTKSDFDIQCSMVFPSTIQYTVLQDILRTFESYDIHQCILTKLDEGTNLGEVISLLIENSLPIAYVSNGQRVPEDISAADASLLQGLLLAMANKYLRPLSNDVTASLYAQGGLDVVE